jgi:hypothetical protein
MSQWNPTERSPGSPHGVSRAGHPVGPATSVEPPAPAQPKATGLERSEAVLGKLDDLIPFVLIAVGAAYWWRPQVGRPLIGVAYALFCCCTVAASVVRFRRWRMRPWSGDKFRGFFGELWYFGIWFLVLAVAGWGLYTFRDAR